MRNSNLIKLLCINIFFAFYSFGQTDTSFLVPTTSPAPINIVAIPEGFEESKNFNGLWHAQTGTSVVLTMVEGANINSFISAMTPSYFADNQLVFIKEEMLPMKAGMIGKRFLASFVIEGQSMIREFALIGDYQKTLWISSTYHQLTLGLIDVPLMEIYKSTDFSKLTQKN